MKDIGLNEMVLALRRVPLDAQEEAARQDLKFDIEAIERVINKEGEGGVKFRICNTPEGQAGSDEGSPTAIDAQTADQGWRYPDRGSRPQVGRVITKDQPCPS